MTLNLSAFFLIEPYILTELLFFFNLSALYKFSQRLPTGTSHGRIAQLLGERSPENFSQAVTACAWMGGFNCISAALATALTSPPSPFSCIPSPAAGYFVAGLSQSAQELLYGPAPLPADDLPSSDNASPAAVDPAPIQDGGGGAAGAGAAAGAGGNTVWVVMKFEGLTPVALYPYSQQRRSGFGMLWGARDSPLRDRVQMLRWGWRVVRVGVGVRML